MKNCILFLVFFAFCFPVMAQQGWEKIVTDSIDGVIVPLDRAHEFSIAVPNKTTFFTPSREDILKAEGKLFDWLYQTTSEKDFKQPKLDLRKKFVNYKRQYVGIIMDGKKRDLV